MKIIPASTCVIAAWYENKGRLMLDFNFSKNISRVNLFFRGYRPRGAGDYKLAQCQARTIMSAAPLEAKKCIILYFKSSKMACTAT